MKMKNNVTLVLSGGGARGFAHIGAIEEIERRGYKITSVAGTSMGALVGGVYAAGKMNEYKNWAYNLNKQNILKLIDFSFSKQGLIKGERVLNAIKEFIPDTNIEDLKTKFTATAFDLTNRKEVVFNSGSLYNAIRASISIPTVFTPVISGNSLLVDGGVVNNIPINNAIRSDNDTLIAVYVNSDIAVSERYLKKSEKGKRDNIHTKTLSEMKRSLIKTGTGQVRTRQNYFNLINRTLTSTTNCLANMIIEKTPPDILIEVSRESCGTFDFFMAENLVEIGRYAAKDKLDSILIN
jgi:NTE family protein